MSDVIIGTLNLTELNDKDNSRTWVLAGHTVAKPQVVIQKRRQPSASPGAVGSSELSTVFGSVDANGDPLVSKVNITTIVRYPTDAQSADVEAAVDAHQILVASTNFDDLVSKQLYLG